MSLLSEFKNDVPLNTLKLTKWLEKIFEKLDAPYGVDSDLISTLYDMTTNSIVTSIVEGDTFDSIFDAIKSDRKLTVNKSNLSIVSGTYTEFAEDDYRCITLDVIGVFSTSALQHVRFEIENLGGQMRLVKTVTDL